MEIKKGQIANLLPARKKDSHKGDFGRVFIFSGSRGMLGAAVLASRGALRSGAGLVRLAVPNEIRDLINLATPEVIISGSDSVREIKEAALSSDAIVIGPGLGEKRNVVRELLSNLSNDKYSRPIVLDADGLNAFAGDVAALAGLKLNLILTPHPGEAGRLLSKTADEIQKDREKSVKEFLRSLDCVLVLKGSRTIVADRSSLLINPTGNPGMATGGVGDILSGLIAGLAAQGLKAKDAACAGVYLHGLAGDLAKKEKGEYGLIASDLVDKIPAAILMVNKK